MEIALPSLGGVGIYAVGVTQMEVVAVSGADNAWRWRIVDPNGKTVEESDTTFPDITSP